MISPRLRTWASRNAIGASNPSIPSGPFHAALSKLSPFRVDMELSASLWLYLIALSLRLTIWKEGSKDFLVIGRMQAVARMHRKDSSRKWIGSDDL